VGGDAGAVVIEIAGGIILAVIVLFISPFVILAIRDWRWWRCLIFGHRWYEVEPFTHSTGVLSMTKRHRCSRCKAVPTVMDEQRMRKEAAA
jgi:hypothetical protein